MFYVHVQVVHVQVIVSLICRLILTIPTSHTSCPQRKRFRENKEIGTGSVHKMKVGTLSNRASLALYLTSQPGLQGAWGGHISCEAFSRLSVVISWNQMIQPVQSQGQAHSTGGRSRQIPLGRI